MAEKKPGLFERMRIFLGEVRVEMAKVSWPTQEETKSYTIVVIVTCAALASAIAVWDLVLTKGISALLGLG